MNTKKLKEIIFSKMFMLLIMISAGILLIFISELSQKGSGSSSLGNTETANYGQYLEEKLCEVLESVTGKDTVKVMITFESTYELGDNDEGYRQVFSDETHISKIIEKPLPKIAGVMIVCKSIKEQSDFLQIKKAAATALNVSEQKIYIIGGKEINEKVS